MIFLICLLTIKIVESTTNYKNYQTAAISANKISYTVYNANNKIGTVYNIDALNQYLVKRFESKLAQNGGELFFGEDISVVETYVPEMNQKDTVETYEKIAEQNAFLIKAMKIKDLDSERTYVVSNLETWTEGIASIEKTLTALDKHQGVNSDTVLALNVEPEPAMVDINEVMTKEELVQTVMNEQNLLYETSHNSTFEEITRETGVSQEELAILNPTLTDSIIMPNVPVQITDGSYRNLFTKTELITVEEDVYFDVEYRDDENLYTGTEEIIQEGIPGKQRVEYLVKYLTDGTRIDINKNIKNVIQQPQTQVVIRGTKEAPNVGTGEYIWPVESRRVSTEFGGDYLYGEYRDHGALDINQGYGAPIWAIDNGVVVEEGFSSSYGYYVIIDHNNGVWSLYAHNTENIVHVGQIVPKGQVIAYMGSTGLSTGPHLHLEIRVGGNSKANSVNPRIYIS